MEELDEFGIPIKKTTSNVQLDEFGIPVKKKVGTQPTGASITLPQKLVSETNTGSLGGAKSSIKNFDGFSNFEVNGLKNKSQKLVVNTKLIEKLNPAVAKENNLKRYLETVKVTPENMDEVTAKTNELSNIKKANAQKSLDAHNRVLNPLWEQANKIDTAKQAKDFNDEANDNQWTDKVREGLKTVVRPFYNSLANFVTGDEDPIDFLPKKEPLKLQKQQVDNNIKEIQKNSPNYNPTEQEKFQMVKDLKYKDLADEQVAKNISKIASNIQGYTGLLNEDDAEVITSLQNKQVQKLKNASDVTKGISYQIQMLDAQAKPLQEIVNHDKKYIQSGNASEQEIADWNKKNNDLTSYYHKYEDLIAQQQKSSKENMSAEEHLHQLKLDYAPLSKFTDDVAGSFGGAIGGLSYLAGSGLNKLSDVFGNPQELKGLANGLEQGGNLLITDSKNRSASHPQYTSDDILDSHPLGWAGQTAATLLPYLASDGAVGLTANVAKSTLIKNAIFASARAGEKLNDINQEELLDPTVKYSNLQKLGSMGSNAIAELVMLHGVDRLSKVFKPSLEVMQPFEKEVFEQGIEGFVKKAVNKSGNFIKEANKSGVTFATVEGIKMLSDNKILGKKVDFFSDKLLEAYKEGWILHGATSTIPAVVNTSKYLAEKIMPNQTLSEIKNNNGQIFKHQSELENKDLNSDEVQSVKNKIIDLENKNQILYTEKLNDARNFTPIQVKELLTIDQNKFAIRNKTEEIKKSNFSNDYKKSALADLKTDFNDLENRRESVFNKESNSIDLLDSKERERLINDAEENLQNRLNPNREKVLDLKPEEIEKEAVSIHLNEIKNQQKLEDAETQSTITNETQPKTEVQKPTEAEKVEVDIPETKKRIGDLETMLASNNESIANGKGAMLQDAELVKAELNDLRNKISKEKIPNQEAKVEDVVTPEQPDNIIKIEPAQKVEFIDESLPKRDTPIDKNIRLGDNTDLQQGQVEAVQPKPIIAEGKTDVEVKHNRKIYTKNQNGNWVNTKTGFEIKGIGKKGKALIEALNNKETNPTKKYKLTEKGQAFNVDMINGKLEVTKINGEKVSKPTERAVLRKYADNIDFSSGDKAINNPIFEPKDWGNEIAKKSSNPSEIAEAINYTEIENISEMSELEKKDYKEQVIVDGFVPIRKSGFNRFGDRNNKTSKTKSYFNENGRHIDDLAKELSKGGLEITPQDIVDFIAENPNGLKSYKAKNRDNLTQEQIIKSNKILDLKERFSDLTGLPANKEFLLKAIEHANRKENTNNALDQLSDKELQDKYNEITEFEKQEYGKQETKQIAKGTDEIQNNSARKETGVEKGKTEQEVKKPTTNEKIVERVKLTDSKIDAKADFVKAKLKAFTDMFPSADINPDDYNINGFSADAIVDMVAKAAKSIAKGGIVTQEHILEAIKAFNTHFEDNVNIEDVKSKLIKKEKSKVNNNFDKDSFETFASIVPNGEVGIYLSGKTIEKYTGENPENNQEIFKVKLDESLVHGVSTIEKAKEKYGSDYVSKTLEYLDTNAISPESKALTYISLENDLVKQQKNGFADDLTIQKQLNQVREVRQAFARSNSLALNMNRLQKFAELGYDINKDVSNLFTTKQKEAKVVIEDAIQHTSEDINKQDDLSLSEIVSPELKDLIQEGVEKQINEIYKKLPTSRRLKADNAIKALEKIQKSLRANAYDATIGIPIVIIDSGITIIKNSIKAGVNIADAIELGINHIKEKYGKDWNKESQFRKDFTEGFKDAKIEINDKKKTDDSSKEIVKQALIDAGYFREIKIKGETVKRLDWVKLAGTEGSADNIKSKVEGVLSKDKNYSKKEVNEIKKSLQDEYNRLGAEIIEKSLNELEKRNLIKPSPKRKSEAKRLAELYNFGLLEKNQKEYDNLLNKTLGLSDFEQKVFEKIQGKSKALADIFNAENNGKKLTEQSINSIANDLNHSIKELLNSVSYKDGSFKYKAMTLLTDYAGLSQKALLGGLPNLIENVTSGRFAGLEQKIFTNSVITPELAKQIKKEKKVIYADITKNAGLYYGDTNTSLVSSSRFEDWINGKTDNQVAHAVISTITLRSWLDGADSRAKVGLSSKLFVKNAVEILTSKTNPNGSMSKDEAVKFVSESLTGDKFEKALETAKSIIDDVNSKQEVKQLRDNEEAVYRFAMNLVKENLMQDNRMSIDEIDVAFKSAYKSAGRDLGHEANNSISKGVNLLNSTLNSELQKAVSEKRYSEATAISANLLVMRTIVNPFVGGGTNWVILGLEKSGNPLGYISTYFNSVKKTDLDLGTVSGIKNMSESLYRKNNYQASLTRNIVGTSIALGMFASMSIKGSDDEDGVDKLNKWLETNKWAKRYFNKLAPESLVFMISMQNDELGKHLAQTLGISGDTYNNISKLLKSLDKKEISTSGKIGQTVGSLLNSPLAWKTVKDIQNIIRGIKGLDEIKTDYKSSGFWNGYFQGGLTEFLGMRPDKENTSSNNGTGIKPKKLKTFRKF